jgi:hypothetical protein
MAATLVNPVDTEMGPFRPLLSYKRGTPTRDRVYCDGNKNLRAPDVEWVWKPEEITETAKCAVDMDHFIKYITIISLDHGRVKFKPRPYQQRIIDTIANDRFSCIMAPRQCGKTTATAAPILHYAMFNEDYNILILAHKADAAKDILARIKMAYEELPYWLKPGVVEWGKERVKFDNGSTISAAATSDNSGRSGSINMLVLEEFAHVAEHVAGPFWASVYATVSSGETTKIIVISTPKGIANQFHTIVKRAERGENRFKLVKIEWDEPPGRDEEFKRKTIADIGELKWFQEFECRFLGSQQTLVSAGVLENMMHSDPVRTTYDIGVESEFRIYAEPQPGRTYAAGVDLGEGGGGDDSVVDVYDITDPMNIEQAAVWSSNKTPSYDMAEIVVQICRFYGEANLLVENNMGNLASEIFKDYEYDRLISYGAGQGNKRKKGITTNQVTKNLMCTNYKRMVETGRLKLRDAKTIKQLASFVRLSFGTYAGQGEKDDHVMSSMIANLANHKELEELIETNDIETPAKSMSPMEKPKRYFAEEDDEDSFDKYKKSTFSTMKGKSDYDEEKDGFPVIKQGRY